MSVMCHELELIPRFTLAGKDGGIRKLCKREKESYKEISFNKGITK